MSTILAALGVRHRYGGRAAAPSREPALVAPDLSLAAGEHCALLGASGCGKTTLLHALAGILRPAEGRITLDDDDLYAPPRGDRWRAARIGVVPQRLHLIGALSALDNVRIARRCVGADDDGAARALLVELSLGGRLDARPDRLSQGQQQRVALARALVNAPRLLLADEPTSALDDAHAAQAIDLLLRGAAEHGALLVVATHDARIVGRFPRVVRLEPPR